MIAKGTGSKGLAFAGECLESCFRIGGITGVSGITRNMAQAESSQLAKNSFKATQGPTLLHVTAWMLPLANFETIKDFKISIKTESVCIFKKTVE